MALVPTLNDTSLEGERPVHAMGVVAGIGSSVAAAMAYFSIRCLAGVEPTAVMTVWYHMISGMTCIVPMLLGFPGPVVWPGLNDWMLLGGLIAASFVGQMLVSRGFSLISPQKAATVNLLQLVHTRILSSVFLNDEVGAAGIGASLLVASAVLISHLGRDGSRRSTELYVCSELDLELAKLAGSENAPLLPPDCVTEPDDSPLASTPVCIPVSQLNALQAYAESDSTRVFVPAREVGNTGL